MGIEPTTFPVARDALAEVLLFYDTCNQTTGFGKAKIKTGMGST